MPIVKLTAKERHQGLDLRNVLGARKNRKPRASTRKASKLGPHERTAGSELERLVDDYLDKHEAAKKANTERERALKYAAPQAEKDRTLTNLISAHNARAAALRALVKARGRR
jgi:hypothetical protein